MTPASVGESQDEVVAFLSRPESVGAKTVEIVGTHASMVFLAGERAFKLKRAVRYSYLDYSTVERRRLACEAELAVNWRFAPTLYLSVEPITRDPVGQLRLGRGAGGETVDWVVVMKRFDPDDQLDRLADRGALTSELARDLADCLAALHDRAAPCSDRGGEAGLRRAVDITVDNLRLETGSAFDAEAVADWTARARAMLHGCGALLERRRRAGKVRACHGDLHLRNVCVIEGRPTPFDAIEFDPSLSSIDVLYDLAFLLMDLRGRGLDSLANLIFNRYLDRWEEEDGLAALPLFLSLRAAIRAQVSAAFGRRGQDPEKAREVLAEAGRYLVLARDLLRPPPARLVAIGGLSGTGKSTLAYRLAPLLGAPPGGRSLRSDVLRKRAAGLDPETRLPSSSYTAASHAETYRTMTDRAGLCLAGGCAVVLDAVFADPAEREAAEAVARGAGVPFQGFWLEAPARSLLERVSGRQADASDATAATVQAQLARQGRPPEGWRRLDAGGDPGSTLRAAAAVLKVDAGRAALPTMDGPQH